MQPPLSRDLSWPELNGDSGPVYNRGRVNEGPPTGRDYEVGPINLPLLFIDRMVPHNKLLPEAYRVTSDVDFRWGTILNKIRCYSDAPIKVSVAMNAGIIFHWSLL
jgi:hypothetical protein